MSLNCAPRLAVCMDPPCAALAYRLACDDALPKPLEYVAALDSARLNARCVSPSCWSTRSIPLSKPDVSALTRAVISGIAILHPVPQFSLFTGRQLASRL